MNSQQMKRSFRISWVYAMAVGSAVGWGAFVLPYEWLATSGLLAVVLGFVIGTALIAVIAINYGYATRALPITGGSVSFALSAFGKMHGAMASWALMLGYISIIALNATATALVFRLIMPDVMQQMPLYQVAGWTVYLPEVLVSSVFLLLFAYLNVKNTALSGWVQLVAVVLMLVAVSVVLLGTGVHFASSSGELAMYPVNQSLWAAVATIIAFAPWAYVGFDSVPQMAGEFRFRASKVLGLLMASVISAGFLYVALIVAAAFAFGGNIKDYADSSWGVAVAVSGVMGKFGLVLMVLSVSAGVLTGLNSFYVAASRVVFTMGQNQVLPAQFAKLHDKHHTPAVAIVLALLVCLIAPWFGRAALLWVVEMASVGIAINFLYTCACVMKLAKTGEVLGVRVQEPNRKQFIWGVLGVIISIGFLLLLVLPMSSGFLSEPSRYALAVWVGFGALLLFIRRKHILGHHDDHLKQALLDSHKTDASL